MTPQKSVSLGIPSDFSYNSTVYSIYVEYAGNDYGILGKTNEIKIKAQGGLGEIKNPEVSCTFENNILTFTNEAKLWCDDLEPIIPSNFVVELQTSNGGYISYNYLSNNKFDS